MIKPFAYQLAALFCRWLPASIPSATAWMCAEISWLTRPHARRSVCENISVIHEHELDSNEVRVLAKRVFHNFCRATQWFLMAETMSAEEFDNLCNLSEFHDALDALGENRPFIMASVHIGPWELGGYAMARSGLTVHTVVHDEATKEVDRFVNQRRAQLGVRTHPVRGSYAVLRQALSEGESVALLIDRAYGPAARPYKLFGLEAPYPTGHLLLAVRSGVPVITGALVFDGARGFKYAHGGTHFASGRGCDLDQIEELQKRCLQDLEDIIRDYSDQWCCFEPLDRREYYGT